MRDAPVEKTVAASVEQTEGKAEEPEAGIGERKHENFGTRQFIAARYNSFQIGDTFIAFCRSRAFAQANQHEDTRRDQKTSRHIESTLPTEVSCGLTGNQECETERDLIASA